MLSSEVLTESKRNQKERLKAAHAVQVRDAEPLIAIENHLRALIQQIKAKGGAVFLSVEDDVPLAFIPPFPLEFSFDPKDEDLILSGNSCTIPQGFCVPIGIAGFTVGFLVVSGMEEALSSHLVGVYALLISKELELANQLATLRYQNESIVRKQKQLEQVIGFKNNILSLTTHDIRSPLTAVIGFMDLLEQGIRHQQPIDYEMDLVKRIRFGLSNVADLVDQLNEIALLELQHIELNVIKVDLNWLVQEVCDVMHGPALAKKHQLQFKRHSKPLYVEIDIQKVKRILFNLINNAIKYTQTGGTITVSLSEEKRMAHVCVKDSGIGISQSKLEAIFEPFHKLNKSGTNGEKSTGLGLFTSNYFIQLFKGSISVESQEGIGSSFYVHLPLQNLGF